MHKESILFIETGSLGGGSFKSLSAHLSIVDPRFNKIVICFNKTKYISEWENLGVQVILLCDPIFTYSFNKIKSYSIAIVNDVLKVISTKLYTGFLKIIHRKLIKEIEAIIFNKNIKIIHLNDQIYRDYIVSVVAHKHRVKCVSHLRSIHSNGITKGIALMANKNTDIYIANSNFTKLHWLGIGIGIASEKIRVIYNPLETHSEKKIKSKSNPKSIPHKNFTLGCVANFTESKGHEFLIRVYKRLSVIRSDTALVLIGGGPLIHSIKKMVHEEKLTDTVKFLGFKENISDLMLHFDLLLVPSKNEGFGRVIVEAMSVQIPVVATSVGGINEIIKDGINGFLVEYNDVDSFAIKISSLLDDSDLRNKISLNAFNNVHEKYSITNYSTQIKSVYSKLLEEYNC